VNRQNAARTEALFREVNERSAEQADGADIDEATFICECDDPSCVHRIQANLDDYEDVRSEPTRFLVKRGHVNDAIEHIVERRHHYDVVEKDHPDAVEIVDETDPR
jgi:hypothetical protein